MSEVNIDIRPLTIDLYEEVHSLRSKTENIGLHEHSDSKDGIASYLERNPGLSFAAFVDREPAGAVLSGHDGRRGYIHHLAVHPSYRKRGIGKMLVDSCIESLRAKRIRKAHIFIFNENESGIEFWKSIGWTHRNDIGVISRSIEPDPE